MNKYGLLNAALVYAQMAKEWLFDECNSVSNDDVRGSKKPNILSSRKKMNTSKY